MKRYTIIPLGMSFLLATLIGACSQDGMPGLDNTAGNQLIEINGKDEGLATRTRAADQGEITPLPVGTQFALRLFYDNSNSTTTNYNTMEQANMLVVSQDTRCIYSDAAYDVNNSDNTNDNSEQKKNTSRFYWNNRKMHGFIGFFLKNKITDGAPSFNEDESSLTFDMHFKGDAGNEYQDDPMLAVKRQQPTSGNNEANRVILQFEHQTACVVVNVKGDGISVEPNGAEGGEIAVVTGISLLGTAKEITVHTKMDEQGIVLPMKDENGEIIKDEDGKETSVKDENGNDVYSIASEDTIKALQLYPLNSIHKITETDGLKTAEVIENDKVKPGYNATAQGLAFGYLRGIGIQWDEYRTTGYDNIISHNIEYSFGDDEEKFIKLQSGKKYIYNISLRRGTIATIKLKIVDWEDDGMSDDDSHKADGIISPNQETTPTT